MSLRSEEQAHGLIRQWHSDELRQLAFYDSLTKLPNRHSFQHKLDRIIRRSQKENSRVGLLYIDLDNFKQVNDNYGHEAGDQLLAFFSERLQDTLRSFNDISHTSTDKLARLASDEFVVILPQLSEPVDAAVVSQRILDLFQGGFDMGDISH